MSLIADMNRVRPAPTVAREARSFGANLAFSLAVVAVIWLFEGPVLVVGIAVGVLLVLLAGRLGYRAVTGDVEATEVSRP